MIVKQSTEAIKMTEKTDLITKKRGGKLLYETNPFMCGTEVSTKTRRITNKRGNMMLVSNEGEIVSNVAGFWEAEEVDSTKFLKLFVNGVKALAELSNAGTKVFELLYSQMQQNVGKDRIYLSHRRAMDSGLIISEATYMRGMRELSEKGFIAATPEIGLFWVNPDYLWNGDRLAFVKEYRRASTKKPADQAERDKLEARGQQRLID